MKLILASSNQHKAEELEQLLIGFEIAAAEQSIEVEEDGETFIENASKKAWAYYKKYKQPVIADDSGLVVQALPNELGVHTARFGGPGLGAEQRSRLLLDRMNDVTERDAYFVCYLCLILNENEVYFFEGRVSGLISEQYKGEGGFGYDPVFIPKAFEEERKTLAELNEWKMLHSHRAVACSKLLEFFKTQQRI